MPTLYVTEPGSRLEKEYHRLLVVKDDEALLSAPLTQISDVVLVGWAGATTPAMLSLLEAGAGLSLVTRSGRLRGRLRPAEARNLPLRRAQYAASGDESFCLEISRAIVAAKLRSSRVLLQRIRRSRRGRDQIELQAACGRALPRLENALGGVPQAGDLAKLRSLEGQAARAYFSVLRAALRPEFHFQKRTRRPPRDPTNALLSLAYSLLGNAVFTACEVAALDPYCGFFHADKYGRPALALDLVEEFRAVVADSVLLTLVNKRMIKEKDFEQVLVGREQDERRVYLTRRGLRVFLRCYARRLQARVFHPRAGRALSYQKIFEVQARGLRKAVETGDPYAYRPFLAK